MSQPIGDNSKILLTEIEFDLLSHLIAAEKRAPQKLKKVGTEYRLVLTYQSSVVSSTTIGRLTELGLIDKNYCSTPRGEVWYNTQKMRSARQ